MHSLNSSVPPKGQTTGSAATSPGDVPSPAATTQRNDTANDSARTQPGHKTRPDEHRASRDRSEPARIVGVCDAPARGPPCASSSGAWYLRSQSQISHMPAQTLILLLRTRMQISPCHFRPSLVRSCRGLAPARHLKQPPEALASPWSRSQVWSPSHSRAARSL
jgi:hypothetical protein